MTLINTIRTGGVMPPVSAANRVIYDIYPGGNNALYLDWGGTRHLVADIGGGQSERNIEAQITETHIQWRYVGDTVWIDLVAIADLPFAKTEHDHEASEILFDDSKTLQYKYDKGELGGDAGADVLKTELFILNVTSDDDPIMTIVPFSAFATAVTAIDFIANRTLVYDSNGTVAVFRSLSGTVGVNVETVTSRFVKGDAMHLEHFKLDVGINSATVVPFSAFAGAVEASDFVAHRTLVNDDYGTVAVFESFFGNTGVYLRTITSVKDIDSQIITSPDDSVRRLVELSYLEYRELLVKDPQTDYYIYDWDGTAGFTVKNGITPHIGYNGNWWIGINDTGKPSRGETGFSMLNPRGVWSSAVADYALNDVVKWEDENQNIHSYVALADVPTGVSPSDLNFWSILVMQGAPGRDGLDADTVGISGVYTEVEGVPANEFEFNDKQAFLDEKINNRRFKGNLLIRFTQPFTEDIAIIGVIHNAIVGRASTASRFTVDFTNSEPSTAAGALFVRGCSNVFFTGISANASNRITTEWVNAAECLGNVAEAVHGVALDAFATTQNMNMLQFAGTPRVVIRANTEINANIFEIGGCIADINANSTINATTFNMNSGTVLIRNGANFTSENNNLLGAVTDLRPRRPLENFARPQAFSETVPANTNFLSWLANYPPATGNGITNLNVSVMAEGITALPPTFLPATEFQIEIKRWSTWRTVTATNKSTILAARGLPPEVFIAQHRAEAGWTPWSRVDSAAINISGVSSLNNIRQPGQYFVPTLDAVVAISNRPAFANVPFSLKVETISPTSEFQTVSAQVGDIPRIAVRTSTGATWHLWQEILTT